MKRGFLLLFLLISSIWTVSAQDLNVTGVVLDNSTPSDGASVILSVTVQNSGAIDATNILVDIELATELNHMSDDGNGDYDNGSGIWTISSLLASADTTLQITTTFVEAISLTSVIKSSTAFIAAFDDDNSNNSNSACLTSPIPICVASGEEFTLSAPTSIDGEAPDGSPMSYALSNFQWLLDDSPYDDGDPDSQTNTLLVSQAGSYTLTAEYDDGTNTCPFDGCCPVVFVEECPCSVSVENPLVGACMYNSDSSQSEASLTFDVSFANVALGEMITVMAGD
ncbi:MAG: hypothetical protein ACPG5B_17160, partial [Chitinophagales bacterium]